MQKRRVPWHDNADFAPLRVFRQARVIDRLCRIHPFFVTICFQIREFLLPAAAPVSV